MAIVLVYKRKTKEKKEARLDNLAQLGDFVFNNQPLEVIAVRNE